MAIFKPFRMCFKSQMKIISVLGVVSYYFCMYLKDFQAMLIMSVTKMAFLGLYGNFYTSKGWVKLNEDHFCVRFGFLQLLYVFQQL